jgi:hypothetical protein
MMEWLVYTAILLEAPNYLCEHDVICTNTEGLNMVQRENKTYTVYHGEPPDQVISYWHSINGASEDNVPKITIDHDSEYDQSFILPLKRMHEVSIYHHIRELRESKILWYNSIIETNKQWKHRKSWYHQKSFLFYSGDTWGETVQIIVG